MIKKLLIVFAAAAVISMACFTILGVLGGFPPGLNGPPWAWRDGGRNWEARGPVVTRNLAYTGGDRLEIYYPAEITVTQGPQPRFTITGPQGLLDRLSLEDGVLSGPRGGRWNWNWGPDEDRRLKIDIVTPDTREFHLSGAQKLTLHNFDQDSLSLYISGAGDVDGDGKAHRLDAQVSGAGHLNLEELPVDDARIEISGAGDASLDARDSAEVSISGAGHIRFKCRPSGDVSQHISGFGSVDEGPNCGALPAPPASSTPPAAPAAPAPKSSV